MYDLVGNPEDRFSHNEAHMYLPLVVASPLLLNCEVDNVAPSNYDPCSDYLGEVTLLDRTSFPNSISLPYKADTLSISCMYGLSLISVKLCSLTVQNPALSVVKT